MKRELLTADDASFVGSGVVLTDSNGSSIGLLGLDGGIALNLRTALDGAGRVLGFVTFANSNSSNVLVFSIDIGIALDLDAPRVTGALGLLSKNR